MRIISGKLKGRHVLVPKNFKGRPTTDFAREGLFNVLHHLIDLSQADVLDLFAGTGAFGLECLSRGARSATWVEAQPLHVKFIRDNLQHFQLEHGQPIKSDVFKYIATCTQTYDLIFADPPYLMDRLADVPSLILEKIILRPEGLLIVEHPKQFDFQHIPSYHQTKKYSNVHFSFFRPSMTPPEENAIQNPSSKT